MSDCCPICQEWIFSSFGSHKCPPRWEVHVPGYHGDDDWSVVYACDAEKAAEKYAERYDSEGDYTVVGGQVLAVHVRAADTPDAPITKYEVHGEALPSYSAFESA